MKMLNAFVKTNCTNGNAFDETIILAFHFLLLMSQVYLQTHN